MWQDTVTWLECTVLCGETQLYTQFTTPFPLLWKCVWLARPGGAHQSIVRPDLLSVLLLEPGRSKFFHFRKIDHVMELMHTCTWLCPRWLICGSAWKLFQAALCYLGPGGVQYIVSRLEDKFSESWVGHVTFFTTVHTCIPLVISVPIACKTQILM